MRVLLTGAFGNIGVSTLDELLRQGHQVRCFDVPTRKNRKTARRYRKSIEIMWGDLRDQEAVTRAVQDQQITIHLAIYHTHAFGHRYKLRRKTGHSFSGQRWGYTESH